VKKYIFEFYNSSGEKHTEEVETVGNKSKAMEIAKEQAKLKKINFIMGCSSPYYCSITRVY